MSVMQSLGHPIHIHILIDIRINIDILPYCTYCPPEPFLRNAIVILYT